MPEQTEEPTKDRHPLITIGLLTAGTQLGSAFIQKLGRQPVFLFGMGVVTGIYSYKHRKEILAEVEHLSAQSKKLLSKKQR